eukprot:7388874-Prymnesium_polylepis.1
MPSPCRYSSPRKMPLSVARSGSSGSGSPKCAIRSSVDVSHASITIQTASSSGVTNEPWKRTTDGEVIDLMTAISWRKASNHVFGVSLCCDFLFARELSSGITLIATVRPDCLSAASQTVPKEPRPRERRMRNTSDGSELEIEVGDSIGRRRAGQTSSRP